MRFTSTRPTSSSAVVPPPASSEACWPARAMKEKIDFELLTLDKITFLDANGFEYHEVESVDLGERLEEVQQVLTDKKLIPRS